MSTFGGSWSGFGSTGPQYQQQYLVEQQTSLESQVLLQSTVQSALESIEIFVECILEDGPEKGLSSLNLAATSQLANVRTHLNLMRKSGECTEQVSDRTRAHIGAFVRKLKMTIANSKNTHKQAEAEQTMLMGAAFALKFVDDASATIAVPIPAQQTATVGDVQSVMSGFLGQIHAVDDLVKDAAERPAEIQRQIDVEAGQSGTFQDVFAELRAIDLSEEVFLRHNTTIKTRRGYTTEERRQLTMDSLKRQEQRAGQIEYDLRNAVDARGVPMLGGDEHQSRKGEVDADGDTRMS